MLDGVGLYHRVLRSIVESYYTVEHCYEGIRPPCIILFLGPHVHISIVSHQANSTMP